MAKKKTPEDPIGSPPVLRVLILEDNPNDAKLAVRALERGGAKVQVEVTDSAEDFHERLEKADYDVILADFNLRGWTAFDALDILKRSGKDIPLIVSTGSLGDDAAAECIKQGAADFILKDRPARLSAAVQRALEEKQLRTETKNAEQALKVERSLLNTLMDNIPDFIYFKDDEGRFTRVNLALAKHLGLDSPAQVLGKTDFDFFAPENAREFRHDEEEIIRTGQPMVGKEEKAVFPDGHETWFSTTKMPLHDNSGNIIGIYGVNRDITEHKRAEFELRRLNRALHTLSRCNEILVRAQSEQELLDSVCHSLVEDGGYRMAWVGLAEHDNLKTVAPVAHAGLEDGYLALGPITWGDNARGQGPTGRAVRSGQPVVNRNTQTDAAMDIWRKEAMKRGYSSSIALPLRGGSKVLGALTIYAVEPDSFDDMEVKLLSELADDLSYGIETFRTRLDRMRAEIALRESEERYRTLFERNLAGVFCTTWDGRILDCNQAMASMLGFASPQEALNHRVNDLYVFDEDRAAFLKRLEAEGRLSNYEMRLQRRDGTPVWLIGNISLLLQTSTGLRMIEGTLIDITERKLAEAENARLAQVVNSSEDAIFSAARDGLIATWNPGAERMYGYSGAEIFGKHFFTLVPEERRQEVAGLERRLLRGGGIIQLEQEDMRKDGSRLHVSLTLSPIKDASGMVTGVSVISRDITERKRADEALRDSEERFRSLVQNATVGIYRTTPEGRILMANPTLISMLGYANFEELTSRDLSESGFQTGYSRNAFRERVELEGEIKGFETAWTRLDGLVTFVRESARAVRGESGDVLYYDGIVEDITEHKRAEDDLHFKTALLEAQSETTLDGILVVDIEDQILLVNRQFAKMWRLPEDAINEKDDRKMIEYIRPQTKDPDAFIEKVRYLNSHPTAESRDELELKDGRVLDRFSSLLQSPTGKLYGRIWYFRDISERKQAEGKMRASEVRYRRLFEAAHDGILILDADSGEIKDANPFLTELLGYSQPELLGKKLWEIGPLRDVLLSKIGFEELQTKGYIRYEELPLQRRDGKNVAVEFVSNVYVAGHLKVIQCNIRDITERKRAEAEHVRLVTAIEQSAEAVVITNAKGGIEYVNPAFTRITGYSREDALGQNPRILKSNRQDPVYYHQLWETILAGKPWQGELINRRKDGGHYTEQMSIAPIKDVHGEVTHFIATKQDVTERRALQAQLQQASKMEAVGRLAGGVAHDFNNLLTVINGYSEILMDRLASDQKASDYLQEINHAGERAASLTRQLLAFSRQQVLAPRVLDLNLVVSNVEKMLRRLIGEDVKVRTVLDPSLVRVKADPGQIEQVLMNLAVNARDAMPLGGNLTIETRNVELDEEYTRNHSTVKPGPHVMLAVSDTGAGMSPETQAHIFEPFFTTKEQGKGTGLGLATVYGIVKQSEGSIWLYSELGHGTVFKVYFPVVTESTAEKEPAKVVRDSASGTETVLVVEDEEGVRSLVHLALSAAGYHVLESKDAESAVALCASHSGPIHLLLTDVVMPQMSGPAVAAKVIALRPDIKILYMSGYTDDAIVHHGVFSNEVPFIQKPFSPLALRKKVREALGGKQEGEITGA